MSNSLHWTKEPLPRLTGSRPLDAHKVQAPCIVRKPDGGFRLFYTGIGPGKPFRDCQGYILSATSDDGLHFTPESGIRIGPQREILHFSLRAIAPTITSLPDHGWRMYFEARGPAHLPTVIRSAISRDQLHWELEPGIRLQCPGGVGGPRFTHLPEGFGRLYCFESVHAHPGIGQAPRISSRIISARSTDGLHFEIEPGVRLPDRQSYFDSAGITAAEVLPPSQPGGLWTMFYSAWQDSPSGSDTPIHPSQDTLGKIPPDDFAAASIASDISGYRSRIFSADSSDGLAWRGGSPVIEGRGYDFPELDGVHAEDMSLIRLDDGCLRMYYAACDRSGCWCIASAVSNLPI